MVIWTMQFFCCDRSGSVASNSVLSAVSANDLYCLAVAMFQVREQGECVVSTCMYHKLWIVTPAITFEFSSYR